MGRHHLLGVAVALAIALPGLHGCGAEEEDSAAPGSSGCESGCGRLSSACGTDNAACITRCLEFISLAPSPTECGKTYDKLEACYAGEDATVTSCVDAGADAGDAGAPSDCAVQSAFECSCLGRC